MRERETVCLTDMAAAYATAYPVATAASAREFLKERGMEAPEYRVDRLLFYLHRRYGWRTDSSLWKAVLDRRLPQVLHEVVYPVASGGG